LNRIVFVNCVLDAKYKEEWFRLEMRKGGDPSPAQIPTQNVII
jgi:hypothetical protein